MDKKIFIASFFVSLSATVALADTQASPCSAARSTVEINECVDKIYRAADAELNRVYAEARAEARTRAVWGPEYAGYENALIASERAWIALRDTNCHLEGEAWGKGSGRTAAQIGCLTRETQSRTKYLNDLFALQAE